MTQTLTFDPALHPRGGPINAGRFTEKTHSEPEVALSALPPDIIDLATFTEDDFARVWSAAKARFGYSGTFVQRGDVDEVIATLSSHGRIPDRLDRDELAEAAMDTSAWRGIGDVMAEQGNSAVRDAVEDALEEALEDLEAITCRRCGDPNDDGEGWDGLCGTCADRAACSECGEHNDDRAVCSSCGADLS